MAKHRGKRRRRNKDPSTDSHHWTPRHYFRTQGRPVDHSASNISILRVSKHRAYHLLFKTLSLEEAIEALAEQGSEIMEELPYAWVALFKDRTPSEAVQLLLRVHRFKKRCTRELVGVCLMELRHDYRRQDCNVYPALVSQQRTGMSRLH